MRSKSKLSGADLETRTCSHVGEENKQKIIPKVTKFSNLAQGFSLLQAFLKSEKSCENSSHAQTFSLTAISVTTTERIVQTMHSVVFTPAETKKCLAELSCFASPFAFVFYFLGYGCIFHFVPVNI